MYRKGENECTTETILASIFLYRTTFFFNLNFDVYIWKSIIRMQKLLPLRSS